jgi:hypothetical protein
MTNDQDREQREAPDTNVPQADGPGAAPPPAVPPPLANARAARNGTERRWIAIGLIAVGVLALLSTLGAPAAATTFFGFTLFTVVGVLVLLLARRTGNDWVLAAAFPAFGLALAVLLPGGWGGGMFLASIGAGFLSLYLTDRERWWALIPMGALFTLSVIAGGGPAVQGGRAGVVLFVGLALTFGLLWRLPGRPQPWAVYPAAALGVLALVVWTMIGDWLLPVILIVVGVALLLRGPFRPTRDRSA